MNNIKTIILLVIVFVLAVAGIYYLYQTQVNKNKDNLLPYPSPGSSFESLTPPSPTPGASPVGSKNPPQIQPESGSNTLQVKNIGIQVANPQASTKISSPLTVSGFANVFEGKVVILLKDSNGKVLGESQATACMGYDACAFETTINFQPSQTQAGSIEVYNPSGVDGSPHYLQQILVRF